MRKYELFNYRAKITKHVDGDTVRVDLDLGVWTHSDQELRLMNSEMKGVQCPELKDKDPTIRARAAAAAARTAELLPIGTQVLCHTERADGWKRLLASIQLPDGRDLGDLLLEEGHAVPYKRRS